MQQNTIPTKLFKQKSYFSNFFHQNVNKSIKNSKFSSDLQLVDVTPCYKNKSKTSKDNYRPISICGALRDLVPFAQLKRHENTNGEMLILVKLQAEACKFTKINTSPWAFFMIFKL